MDPKNEDKRKALVAFIKEYNVILSFFYELFFVLLGLILLGVLIDNYFHTKVLFTVIFALLGIFSVITNLYKRTKKR
ncbi:MAG: AtpZ/AtpI family protein [Acholeplasma sp.]|nr:AtpZ/AtpI family protein [Acholeplasma sp.]